MKKHLPWIALLVATAWIISAALRSPAPTGSPDYDLDWYHSRVEGRAALEVGTT